MVNKWWRFFNQDSRIKYAGIIAAGGILAQVIILLIYVRPQGKAIFLHYTTYQGTDFVGAWYLAYSVPIISALVLAINATLAGYLSSKDKLLSYLLMIGSAGISVIFLAVAILIVRLNA